MVTKCKSAKKMRYKNCIICTQRYDERDIKLGICLHCREGISRLKKSYVRSLEELDIPPFDSMFPLKTKPTKTIKPRKEGINLHSLRKRVRTHQLGKV